MSGSVEQTFKLSPADQTHFKLAADIVLVVVKEKDSSTSEFLFLLFECEAEKKAYELFCLIPPL